MKIHTRRRGRLIGFTLLLIIVASSSGLGVYSWQHALRVADQKEADEAQQALRDQVQQLQQQVDQLTVQDTADDSEKNDQLTSENAKQIVENASWADLGQLISGDTVEIILAASEGLGNRTIDQMVDDLAILERAVGPWNFELPAEVLRVYREGGHSQYFPSNNIVIGRSSDGQVVSFILDKNNMVKTIFIAPSDEILR